MTPLPTVLSRTPPVPQINLEQGTQRCSTGTDRKRRNGPLPGPAAQDISFPPQPSMRKSVTSQLSMAREGQIHHVPFSMHYFLRKNLF